MATQTISMTDVHRRASTSFRLCGTLSQPVNFPAMLCQPKRRRRPRDDFFKHDTFLTPTWLDNPSAAKALLHVVNKDPDDAPQWTQAERDSLVAANQQCLSERDKEDVPQRDTLPYIRRESFDGLRIMREETVSRINNEFEPHSPIKSSTTVDSPLPSPYSSDEQPPPTAQTSPPQPCYEPHYGMSTNIAEDVQLRELLGTSSPTEVPPNLAGDIVSFSVLNEDLKSLPAFSWVSVAPFGSVARGVLEKGDIRRHAATRLKAEPRSIGLWYEDWPSRRTSSVPLDEETSRQRRYHVSIILDPYIRVIHAGEVYSLDYSPFYYQKVDWPIGMIRKDVKRMLQVSDMHELRLFSKSRELVDDRIPLKAMGFDKEVCQGFQPLYLLAEVVQVYKTCEVCGEDKHLSQFLSQPYTSTCAHEPQTCNPCLQYWIDVRLTSQGHTKITCPQCPALLTHNDIRASATPAQFARYDRLVTRAALSTIPNFRWCLSSSCPSGQIHHDDSPIFVCASCGHKHCIVHSTSWHEGETCAAYDYRASGRKSRDEMIASEQLINQTTKNCPGSGCGASIEKNKGCDHMTCKMCKHEFCWVCLADYGMIRRFGNAWHNLSCKYYAEETTGWGELGEDAMVFA